MLAVLFGVLAAIFSPMEKDYPNGVPKWGELTM